jgi:glycosyltransferase involved in cell wall biosynthesis
MALISVVLPAFNSAATIQETIASVLNQTFIDFELIVINDGSQDATLSLVAQIIDPRIQVFSYTNAGLSASRNRGIAHAQGEYVAFIDADDLWTTDKLEAQLNALGENSAAAVAYSWTNYIDATGQFLRRGSYMTVTGDVYKQLLLLNFLENGSNPLIRKSALTTVGGFDESLRYVEDWDVWLKLAARYPFVGVRSPQVLYRVSTSSLSTHIARMETACLQVIERAFLQAPDSLQGLKSWSLGNIYKYLTAKALEGVPSRGNALEAIRLLKEAVRHDPRLLRTRIFWKALLKILTVVLLSTQLAEKLLLRFSWLANTTTLYGYLRLEPS